MIGADGANSRVAKDIDAGEYDYAIAFQASKQGVSQPAVPFFDMRAGKHRLGSPACQPVALAGSAKHNWAVWMA